HGTITLRTAFIVPAGATLTIPAGWTLNHTGYSLTNNGSIIVNGSIVPPLSRTVSYDMKGHGTQIASLIGVTAGSKLEQPANPTAEGYIFGGWYKDSGCTSPWNFSVDVITDNTTLYAKWTAIPTVPVTGVSLNKKTLNLSVGGSDMLIVTVSPDNATNRSVIWTSTSNAVTLIQISDTSCRITGASVGEAGVLVMPADGGEAADHCVVTVSKAPQNITGFLSANTSVLLGEEINLTAISSSGLPVTYTSSNPAVARIANNKIIAVGAGSATITANQAGNDNYDPAPALTRTLTVTSPVTGVSLNKKTLNLSVGGSDTLIATVFPLDATNRSVTWGKEGNGVSIFHLSDTSYIITGTSTGTSIVWVRTADGGEMDYCGITVSAAVSKKPQSIIDFYSNNITRPFSATDAFILQQAHATSGLPVSYTIENPSGITVADLLQMGENTIVIPRNIGTAIITAHQDGNDEYFAAESVSIMLTIVQQTDISTVDESSFVTVRFYNKILDIDSPVAEQIKVYTLSGELLDKVSKPAGKASFTIPNSEQILIVKGSSGWAKKVKQE
ncbi:MAG: InlB B-repeat-containing protein, partial [Dysgonamonadaceae bacterium]|nr:InlB B-repeat-containing protein [Dysgonamonadaceae bacterium]